jgi:hypothetical protein
MAGHGGSKNGAATLSCVPAMQVFNPRGLKDVDGPKDVDARDERGHYDVFDDVLSANKPTIAAS